MSQETDTTIQERSNEVLDQNGGRGHGKEGRKELVKQQTESIGERVLEAGAKLLNVLVVEF